MKIKEQIFAAFGKEIDEVNISGYGQRIPGKVRDCYKKDGKRILIASDRLSAFDKHIDVIPFKGAMLTGVTAYWFEKMAKITDNHLLATPHPNVMIVEELDILPVEVIVRGYIAGSAWRSYERGRDISGVVLPSGLKQFDKLDKPVITPSTKARQGERDEPISEAEIIKSGLIPEEIWKEITHTSLRLFEAGSAEATKRGLILVDTKYEFGISKDPKKNGRVVLADEVHTQDSSRYWVAESHEANLANSKAPDMLDKEFVRRHLMELGFNGEGKVPKLSDDFRIQAIQQYARLYKQLTGLPFDFSKIPNPSTIQTAIDKAPCFHQ